MSQVSATDPEEISPVQPAFSARYRFPKAGVAGLVVLAFMTLSCLITLPWTMGSGPGGQPRYNAQALDGNLLPPSWAPIQPADAQRREAYLGRLAAEAQSAGRESSSPISVLGTDELGRDFLTRCLAGGGVSLTIGLAAAAISVFIGTLYGMIAGFVGGRTDAFMMRIVDILYGLPYVLLVVLLAVAVDGLFDRLEASSVAAGGTSPMLDLIQNNRPAINILTLLVAIGGVSWLTMARVIRGQVLSLKNQPFMEACRALGIPASRQFTRHLLPNLLGPIIVYATLTVPQAILQESFLSFLGIGIQAPMPSWGNLAASGLAQINPVNSRWWLILWPCLLLALTLLSLNFLGEWLREVFDPRRRVSTRA